MKKGRSLLEWEKLLEPWAGSRESRALSQAELMCSVVSDSFATPWTIVHQVPLSVGFSRQEYWSGFPFPSPGDLPDPGIKPRSPVSLAWQVDSLLAQVGS